MIARSIHIHSLYVSQRNLRRIQQVPAIVVAILQGDTIPPVRLTEADDGTVQVDDGHHRIVAYALAGRSWLEPHEYKLTLTDTSSLGSVRFHS